MASAVLAFEAAAESGAADSAFLWPPRTSGGAARLLRLCSVGLLASYLIETDASELFRFCCFVLFCSVFFLLLAFFLLPFRRPQKNNSTRTATRGNSTVLNYSNL